MKILVTGHKGLIGQRIYERLKLFHDVTGWDREDRGIYYKFYTEHCEPKPIKYDLVIHCAANCIIRDIIEDPELAAENVHVTQNLMELIRDTGCKKIVMFSSSRVEHDDMNPYTAGKKYAENLTEAYNECYGIEYLIVRPETVWGMNDNPVRVIPRWIKQALNNEKITVYGNKNKTLPPIYVDDFVDAFMGYFNDWKTHKNSTVKIAGKHITVGEIIKIIKHLTNSKSKVKFTSAELSQPQEMINYNYHYDSDEVKFLKRLREVLKNENIINRK